jgi:TonB family protein
MLTALGAVLLFTLQRSFPPSERLPIAHWQTAVEGSTVETDGPLFRISGGKGWSRALVPRLDYVFRVQYRLATPDARGAVLVRAWQKKMKSWPESGYRIAIGGTTDAPDGSITTLSRTPTIVPAITTAGAADGTWHLLEIECRGNHIAVRVDDVPVATMDGAEPVAGYVGLEHDEGTLEFRGMQYDEPPSEPWTRAIDIADSRFSGIKPVAKRTMQPRFPETGMKDHGSGRVVFEAVVGTDGAVQALALVRSLRPDFDSAAWEAARRWKFKPAIVNGQPVPAVIALDFSFALH